MYNIDIDQRRYNTLLITGIALPLLLYGFLTYTFLKDVIDIYYLLKWSRIIIWVVLGALFVFAKYGECNPFLLWQPDRKSFWWYAGQVLIIFLLSYACGIIAASPRYFGYHESNVIMKKIRIVMQQYPALRVGTCITAGVTEELIFRGYILSRLTLLLKNKYMPLIISALIFAFVHLTYHSITELIFAFCIGLVYGYHYQKYRNIYPLIITHIIIDLLATGLRTN